VLVVVFITKSADRHFDQSELSKSVELIALNLQHCRKNTSATAADQNQKRPENIAFKRLIFEIAFREFEHAIAQEMIIDNDLYPPADLLYEMRSHYDRVARVIGSDLYSY
jgi:hypothetical protein